MARCLGLGGGSADLQIVAEQGCTCQACGYTWAPGHYLHRAL